MLSPSTSRKHTPDWQEINENEMKKFLALILLMGHLEKDTVKEYWSTDKMLETSFFRKVMSLSVRFLSILGFLYFEDNENSQQRDSEDYDRM